MNQTPHPTPTAHRESPHHLIPVILLFLAGAGAYGNTLNVPFYLDDHNSILENPAIFDPWNISAIWDNAKLRFIGYWTLAVNFSLHQFQVAGYHIVNILIHISAALATYFLVLGLLQTPRFREPVAGTALRWLPLLCALIFLLHPLQTQAVTYIIQRLASLAALFYLASLACFVHARLARRGTRAWLLGGASLLLTGMALLTKQNASTLPAALFLIELIFFNASLRRGALILTGLSLIVAALWIAYAKIALVDNPFSLTGIWWLTRVQGAPSLELYLSTQLLVIWRYVGLFLAPMDLRLEYFVTPLAGFADDRFPWLLGSHLLVIATALWQTGKRPLPAFGVLLFYLAHVVESGLIPLPDFMFEHRTYLPNAGLALAAGWAWTAGLPRLTGARTAAVITLLLLAAMAVGTWQRNAMWRDPVLMYKDNNRLEPESPRALSDLGRVLLMNDRPREALSIFGELVETTVTEGRDIRISGDLAVNLIWALGAIQEDEKALILANQFLGPGSALSPVNHSRVLTNRGSIYGRRGEFDRAVKDYRKALKIFPYSPQAMDNLAKALILTGDLDGAAEWYQRLLDFDPHYAMGEGLAEVRKALIQRAFR